MVRMSKRTRRKFYNRVAMMFRRKAQSLGNKGWKWEVKIDGLRFEEYLDKEIKNYDPETAELTPDEMIEAFKQNIMGNEDDKTSEKREKTEYVIDPQVLRLWDSETEEERYDEMKSIEREFNEQLEAQRTPVCPRCRSNPCICRDKY